MFKERKRNIKTSEITEITDGLSHNRKLNLFELLDNKVQGLQFTINSNKRSLELEATCEVEKVLFKQYL